MKPLDILIALAVPILWGMGLVIAKPAIETFPPILLMCLRFTLTALLLIWFVPVPRYALKALALGALVGSTFQYGMTFNGLKLLDAGTTALIVQAEVVFLVLIAGIWLDERLTVRKWFGMAVAFVGLIIVFGAPRLQGQEFGIALVLGGAMMWAIGQIMVRRIGELGGMVTIAWIAAFAAPQLAVASVLIEGNPMPHLLAAGWRVWAVVAYLGIAMTALAYSCWYHVLGRYEASRVGPFLLLTPVASVLGGWVFLGEPLSREILLGGAVLIAGVAMLVVERRDAEH